MSTPPPFKMAMYLPELGLPFSAALPVAAEIGAKHIWHNFSESRDEKSLVDMSDAEIDAMASEVRSHDLELFLILAGAHFKQIHLAHLDLDCRAAGFAAVIYGHSHQPEIKYKDKVLYLNPGSIGPRRFDLPLSYAMLKITEGTLIPELVEISN